MKKITAIIKPFKLDDVRESLSAKGISEINNIEQIDRGYEDIDLRLNALGANITRK